MARFVDGPICDQQSDPPTLLLEARMLPEIDMFEFFGVALDCLVVLACALLLYAVVRWGLDSRRH